MIIHRMTACFGSLENRTLELGGGLNVLFAPNESGKSTWCAFIRAMLYGVSTAEREKQGEKPDKVKYAPWSGSPMSGSMDLTWAGKAVTLRRWTGKPSQPMQEFSATYIGTDEPVPGLTADNAGEVLTGVPRAVFERSAFIRQGGLGISNSAELEKRINSLVSTGDEDISFSETDKRLRAWQRRRRSGSKRGALPELEAQMAAVSDTLRQIRTASEEALSLDEELSDAKAERENAVLRMEQSRALQRRTALENMASSRREMQARETARNEAAGALARHEAALSSALFAGKPPEEAVQQAENDKRRARGMEKQAKRVPALWLSWVPLGIALALGAIAAFLHWPPYLVAAGALFVVLFVVLYLRLNSLHKISVKIMADRQKILDYYGAADEAGIDAALADYEDLWQQKSRMATKFAVLEKELSAAREAQRDTETELVDGLDFSNGDTEAARAGRAVAQWDKRIKELGERRAMAEGKARATGDPVVLESELAAMQERYEALTQQYGALDLAIETLARADAELQSRFSPLLSRRAAELFASLTDGRYDEVTLSKDLSAKARLTGTTLGRETAFLSEGATDQLYLALRLSVCELALGTDEPCPMVMDDALVNFDDARMARALKLIREIAKTRQILLFTCHGRETLYFSGDASVRKTPAGE